MTRKILLLAIIGFFLLNVRCGRHNLPNVIIILADDMGYQRICHLLYRKMALG